MRVKVIDKFTCQMKNSGYDRTEIIEVVMSALRGFKRKVERRKEAGEEFYRSGKSTLSKRVKNKLLEKTSWYKSRGGEREKEGDKHLRSRGKGGIRKTKTSEKKCKIMGVMYVPFTKGSRLAKDLREGEMKIGEITD